MGEPEHTARLLIVLQNAYAPTSERRAALRDRQIWEEGLWASHTGKRLQGYIPLNCEYRVINATPVIGDSSTSVYPPDVAYLRREIEEYDPTVILACGKNAQYGLVQAGCRFICAPHPAFRALSAAEVDTIRAQVKAALSCY